MQLDNERVINSLQNHAFNSRVSGLAFSQNHVFFEGLHSENVAIVFFLDQVHLAKRPPAYDFDDLEVLNAYLLRVIVWIGLVNTRLRVSDRPCHVTIHIR